MVSRVIMTETISSTRIKLIDVDDMESLLVLAVVGGGIEVGEVGSEMTERRVRVGSESVGTVERREGKMSLRVGGETGGVSS